MRKTIPVLLLPILILLQSACGLLREPEEASSPIEAIPLAQETATSHAPAAHDDGRSGYAQSEQRIFQISQAGSQVRFELDEVLRGQPTTVVGITDQVAGEIALNFDDLSAAAIGIIQINARTLTTDNNFRNRAIHNEILDTGRYEFITFTPTAINGLPPNVPIGEEVSFTISGDLTIREVTQPVTFEVEATALSSTEVAASATTVIPREAFDLTIPEVRNVADVEAEVELYIDFLARA